MARGKAEDAGGLTPAKDDNAAPYHFDPRTLPIFMCVDYTGHIAVWRRHRRGNKGRGASQSLTPRYASLTDYAVRRDSGAPGGRI